ncbi:MAG: flagellar basal body rod protein FlgC [Lachnospiraceae bacterium]|nr:flagellar basal body rod protein FlgC [Lachnospiraceae bacterium]
MSIFTSWNINASGMTAQRLRMDTIAENLANANTTRTLDGEPYRRKVVTFAEKEARTPFSRVLRNTISRYAGPTYRDNWTSKGVKVDRISEDTWTQMNIVYDPSHPDADENGYVTYPNVNTITEMTNLIDAQNAYTANATAFEASKAIATRGLNLASGSV